MHTMIVRLLRFFPRRWWKPSAWKIWGTYLHWRLETYGVYYPDERINWKAMRSLLRQIPSYNAWLAEIDKNRSITDFKKNLD
jgi:hypothetical protein